MHLMNLGTIAETGISLSRGTILELQEDGSILVTVPGDPPLRLVCDFLQTADAPALALCAGDEVLVSLPRGLDDRGCVLGRIGPYRRPEPPEAADNRHVVIEAEKDLQLKCGPASVTLHQDGKVLIQGLDVVSRAKRNQRIKGGSVQIN
jgi:hypothetical protein